MPIASSVSRFSFCVNFLPVRGALSRPFSGPPAPEPHGYRHVPAGQGEALGFQELPEPPAQQVVHRPPVLLVGVGLEAEGGALRLGVQEPEEAAGLGLADQLPQLPVVLVAPHHHLAAPGGRGEEGEALPHGAVHPRPLRLAPRAAQAQLPAAPRLPQRPGEAGQPLARLLAQAARQRVAGRLGERRGRLLPAGGRGSEGSRLRPRPLGAARGQRQLPHHEVAGAALEGAAEAAVRGGVAERRQHGSPRGEKLKVEIELELKMEVKLKTRG